MPNLNDPYYQVSVEIPDRGGQAIVCRLDVVQDYPAISDSDILTILQAIATALEDLGYTENLHAWKVFIDEEVVDLS